MVYYEQRLKMSNINDKLPSMIFFSVINFFKKKYNFNENIFLEQRSINRSDLQVKIIYLNELIDEVIKETKDYSVLYHLATLATPKHMGVLGYMMLHSSNISDAMNKMCKYYLLIGKSIKPVFIKTHNAYKIGIYENNEKNGLQNLEKYKAQIHLFAIIHLINNIAIQKIKPSSITFIQDKPLFSNFNNDLGIKIEFNSAENAIYFDKNIENIKTISSNNKMLKYFEQEAQEILKLNLIGETLTIQISGLILASTSELDISLNSIANKTKFSVRVLQKLLKKEGTTFSQILEDVRKKLATYYLIKGIDIETISISLGFSELSSFFRIFKKWYSLSPKEWLKRQIR